MARTPDDVDSQDEASQVESGTSVTPDADARSVENARKRTAREASLARLFEMRRRTFLQLTGVGAAGVGLEMAGCDPDTGLPAPGQLKDISLIDLPPVAATHVYRRDDFVALRIGYINLQLDPTRRFLVRSPQGRMAREDALLVVEHQPQHILEKAYFEDVAKTDWPTGLLPVASRIAGPSRVVYRVPPEVDQIPFTSEGILQACRDYDMVVGINATPPDPPITRIFVPSIPITSGNVLVSPLTSGLFANVDQLSPNTSTLTNTRNLSSASDKQLVDNANVLLTDNAVQPADRTAPALTSDTVVDAVRNSRGAAQVGRRVDIGLGRTPGNIIVSPEILEILPTYPRKPTVRQTALEVPFRLTISPNRYGAWAHALTPVTGVGSGRTELWHSRLGIRAQDRSVYEGASYLRAIRALWTRDGVFEANPNDQSTYMSAPSMDPPFRASLRPRDRIRIVHQTSNFLLFAPANGTRIKPRAVAVDQLMLSSLGAWVDFRGDWGDAPPLNLAQWEHRGTMGRDQYVKVVETGYLYPFGHRAVLVTITERKFKDEFPSIAYLWQRQFIVVKQPVATYETGVNLPGVGKTLRQMPLKLVHVKTLVTPNLDAQPQPTNPETDPPVSRFVPKIGGKAFRFECEALDLAGNIVKFSTPVVWVEGNKNAPPSDGLVASCKSDLAALPDDEEKVDFAGQRLAYAPAKKPDDTTYETKSIIFTGDLTSAGERASAGYDPPFLPRVETAALNVEAARALAGAGRALSFSYHQKYKDHGFDGASNKGEVIFGLAASETALDVDFSKGSDKSGGFITPNIQLSGLSRSIGPVAGDATSLDGDVAAGKFNANKFFAGLDAKIFGVINLFDILPLDDLLGAPKFITQALDEAEAFIEDVKSLYDDLLASKAALESAGVDLIDDADKLLDDLTDGNIGALSGDLAALAADLVALPGALPNLPLASGLKKDLTRRAQQLADVMGTIQPILEGFAQAEQFAREMRVKLEWRPRIQKWPAGNPIFEPENENNALILSAELRAKAVKGKPAGVDLVASLEKFNLNLIGKNDAFLILKFDRIEFSLLAGKKPDVNVIFDEVVFAGVLSFVETLKDLIPLEGFSDPPNLVVDISGITAGFSLPLPDLAIGVFSLTNMSLGAEVHIPFIGDPLTFTFNFCTRESPFILTVCMIGGGGFFGITITPDGVQILEAALEAGAQLAVDFGVASGSISVMVGVYFKIESGEATLTGYFRLHGAVNVLGLITASITLYLELRYEFATEKLIGKAELSISIEIFFLSFSVTITCERKLAGANGDPTFAQLMAPEPENDFYPWQEYVDAFAA